MRLPFLLYLTALGFSEGAGQVADTSVWTGTREAKFFTFTLARGHQTPFSYTNPMDYSDNQLILAIKGSDPRKRDWALYQFYKDASIRSFASQYVKSKGGREEDAEDVFQEAIYVFDRNIREGKFEGNSSLKTYLLSIVKWGWVTYLRKQDKLTELKPGQMNGISESVENQYFKKEKTALLEKAIQALDERCQQLLRYYKLDYSMKEIQSLLGFSSPAMAKKQAYRCRERLRKVFLQNPALLKAVR